MAVLLETSLGDIVLDLLVDQAPKSCENFLKLCKIKYYNFSPVHSVQQNFTFQTGDPIGPESKESDGGSSIWGIIKGAAHRTYTAETKTKIKHSERGTVSMATAPADHDPDERVAASQFLITLADGLDYLDGKAAIFGKVVEGFDVLEKINDAFVDESGRPLRDIRIRHTAVLDDPFPDPEGLLEPPESPPPTAVQLATVRIADDEKFDHEPDEEELEKLRREREARAQATTLELIGDLPFAEVKPPENILFVCKLNPVTRDEDLELFFGRFGKILSCEIIRDKKSGDSLQYAFIEFENQKDCEQAYVKMDNVLIDDHRIHVDFSQSVSKLSDSWRKATNSKRAQHRGGFGGISSLEKRRQYRDDGHRAPNKDHYGMIAAAGAGAQALNARIDLNAPLHAIESRTGSEVGAQIDGAIDETIGVRIAFLWLPLVLRLGFNLVLQWLKTPRDRGLRSCGWKCIDSKTCMVVYKGQTLYHLRYEPPLDSFLEPARFRAFLRFGCEKGALV